MRSKSEGFGVRVDQKNAPVVDARARMGAARDGSIELFDHQARGRFPWEPLLGPRGTLIGVSVWPKHHYIAAELILCTGLNR
jgi:hypothetical protein